MLAKYPIFYVTRLVLETRTPLSISVGRGDGVFDSALVRDANDLPAIPSSSFAGVLRHLYCKIYDEEATKSLFGYARQSNAEDDSMDKPSQIHVSWGCIHDSQDKPVEGLEFDQLRLNDPLLVDALQPAPVVRQHVCLTHLSAAAESGQFDRTSLRVGHRFTIELSLWSDTVDDPRWESLLCLLEQPAFRLGGASRRGLGAFDIKRLHKGKFDLRAGDTLQTRTKGYADLPTFIKFSNSNLSENNALQKNHIQPTSQSLYADVTLIPLNGYRFGQGTESLKDEQIDLLSVQEKKIMWKGDCGHLATSPELVIPASSIKGALSHRLAFHHNALDDKQPFADELDDISEYGKSDNKAVKALFGYAKDDKNSQYKGQAGHVLLDDVYLPPKPEEAFVLVHNGIDRFTGGVRNHVLFSEELIGQKDVLDFRLTITQPDHEDLKDYNVRTALKKTLCDLIEGRLSLGAGGGRSGHGFFSGKIKWSDDDQWISGEGI